MANDDEPAALYALLALAAMLYLVVWLVERPVADDDALEPVRGENTPPGKP